LPLTYPNDATTNLATSLVVSLTSTSLPKSGVPYASLAASLFLTYKTLPEFRTYGWEGWQKEEKKPILTNSFSVNDVAA